MDREDKELFAFIINLNSQILRNQIDAINGNLTNGGYKNSEILVNDCVEVINKLTKPIKTRMIEQKKDECESLNYND